MRNTLRLFAKYSPSIKFVGGPHPIPAPHPATVHPCAPNGLRPSTETSSVSYATVPFQSRNNLSSRFRYATISEIEIDDVLTGGADILLNKLN